MASAALGGYVLCGINDTRRGEALARDILRADCQILLTDPAHKELLDGLELPGVQVLDVSSESWSALLAGAGPLTPYREVAPTDTFMMIFTSGTSGEPKAVQITHLVVLFAGLSLIERFEVDRLRRLLSVDAAVSLQRAAGRLERGGGRRHGHGPRHVFGIRVCFPICAATAPPT